MLSRQILIVLILFVIVACSIIMGDFNSEWLAEDSVIRKLAADAHFLTHEPDADNYNTYEDKRLDWILITKDMEFVNYQVLP
jgi:endonuclease/exonuclease/phosphatase family metal-dependent hydrolase